MQVNPLQWGQEGRCGFLFCACADRGGRAVLCCVPRPREPSDATCYISSPRDVAAVKPPVIATRTVSPKRTQDGNHSGPAIQESNCSRHPDSAPKSSG